MNNKRLYSLLLLILSVSTLHSRNGNITIPVVNFYRIEIENSIYNSSTDSSYTVFTSNGDVTLRFYSKNESINIHPYIEGWRMYNGQLVYKEYYTSDVYDTKKIRIAEDSTTTISVVNGIDSKVFTLHPIKLKFITPAGNPVSSPVQDGEGQNEFVFQRPTVIGYNWCLKIPVKVEISSINSLKKREIEIAQQLFFKVDQLENEVKPFWNYDSSKTLYGKPELRHKKYLETTLQYDEVPRKNSSFGPKNISVVYIDEKGSEIVVAKQKIEYFFRHNDYDYNNQPNWFFYWKEGGVLPILKEDNVTFKHMNRMVAFSKGQKIVVGQKAIDPSCQQFPAEGNFIFVNSYNHRVFYRYISTPSTIIDALCYTVAHEKLHTIINKQSKGLPDRDEKSIYGDEDMGDRVADKFEVSEKDVRNFSRADWYGKHSHTKKILGVVTCRDNKDTWNILPQLGEQYRDLADNEMRVRMSEVKEGEKLILTFRKDLNWSNYVGKPDYNAMSNYGN